MDSGRINLDQQDCEHSQEGNFCQLLRFRVDSGDNTLKTHLENSAANATYTCGQIQNEIITACNKLILQKVIEKANKSHCFSIAADETTDISTTEQVSICIRFLDKEENVNESFLQFVPVASTRGEDLAKTILDSLESM